MRTGYGTTYTVGHRSRPRSQATRFADAGGHLRGAWNELLSRYAWAWYCHFTFTHWNGAAGAWDQFGRFERRLARAGKGPPPWFALLDVSPSGRLHFHVLLGPLGSLGAKEIVSLWWGGKERVVERFDRNRPGIIYLSNKLTACDVADEQTEVDFRRKLDRAFSRARALD